MERVLVVGATGLLGRPVAQAFARQDFVVRVMARNEKHLADTFGPPFELAPGDASNQAVVDEAVAGCDGVHISVAHGGDETPVVTAVIRAAARAGVKRLTYVSGTSVREENAWFPMVAAKLEAERLLAEGGVPYTILRPTWFMEAIASFCRGERAVCFGDGLTRFRLLAAGDLAALVPRAHRSPEAANRGFRLLGPQPIALHDAIDRYRAARCPHIEKVTHLPFWIARSVAAFKGRDGAKMAQAIELIRYFERVQEGDAEPDVERVLGACPTTFAAWLAEPGGA